MSLRRKVIGVVVALIVIVVLIAAAFYLGLFGTPSAGVADHGDWGTVSENRTEVITTVWVDNPNPLGITIGDSVRVNYTLSLNDVDMATGQKSGISIPSGNNTIAVSTYIYNDKLPRWWAAFVDNNETIPLRVDAQAHVSAGSLSGTFQFPSFERTLLADSTPVINALSQSAANTEGNYTKTVGVSGVEETVGYEVRRGWATWESVSEDTTTVAFHFRLHNPSRAVAVPAVPDGMGLDVEMNDVSMFEATGEELSPRNLDGDAVIQPGETREVVFDVEMDNDKIDDWFRSHVRNGERTSIETRLQLVFDVKGTEFRIPGDSGPAYTCELRTAILVDDQNTTTDCGQPESVPGGETLPDGGDDSGDGSDSGDDSLTSDPTGTTVLPSGQETTIEPGATTSEPATTEPSGGSAPTAVAAASPTEGEAPLDVTFDASDTTDPDGDVQRYVWRFDDGSLPQEGETVTHTYRVPGEYTAELTVIDSEGNRDTATVTITVESTV